jgi:hypothetical protein
MQRYWMKAPGGALSVACGPLTLLIWFVRHSGGLPEPWLCAVSRSSEDKPDKPAATSIAMSSAKPAERDQDVRFKRADAG